MSYIIDDRRTEGQKADTVGFVVATDSFMSGWGRAPGRSLFAVPFADWEQADAIEGNLRKRSEMKRVRVVLADYRPKLHDGDHLSIRELDPGSTLYQKED